MKDKENPREFYESKISGLLDQETEFNGDLFFRGSFRIEGNFKGTIKSDSLLIIGEKGRVEAEIRVGQVVINGDVKGTIQATERVEIHSKGRVCGSIQTPKLMVEEGAYLEATCQAGEKPPAGQLELKDKVEA